MKSFLLHALTGIMWILLYIASTAVVVMLIEAHQPHPEKIRVESKASIPHNFPVLVLSTDKAKIIKAGLIMGDKYTSGEYKKVFKNPIFLVPERKLPVVNELIKSHGMNNHVEIEYLSDGRQQVSAEIITPDDRIVYKSWYIADSHGITPEYYQYDHPLGRRIGAFVTGGIINLFLWAIGAGVRNRYRRRKGKEIPKTFLWQ
ncbi:MAG: hypothetical protein ACYC27_10160 [Armatimonadota bacterium]